MSLQAVTFVLLCFTAVANTLTVYWLRRAERARRRTEEVLAERARIRRDHAARRLVDTRSYPYRTDV